MCSSLPHPHPPRNLTSFIFINTTTIPLVAQIKYLGVILIYNFSHTSHLIHQEVWLALSSKYIRNLTTFLHLSQLLSDQPKSLSTLPANYKGLLTNLSVASLPLPSLVFMPELFSLNKNQITSPPCSKPSNIFPSYLEKIYNSTQSGLCQLHSLCSNQTNFVAVLATNQVYSHLRAFTLAIFTLWDVLPRDTHTTCSLIFFKSLLKCFLFSEVFPDHPI